MDAVENIIEAVLFSAGEAINFSDLLDIAGDLGLAKPALKDMVLQFADSYNKRGTGLEVVVAGEWVQLVARAENIEYIKRVLKSNARQARSLSKSALEILAVVAYNQPVTKSYIEQLRGVDSSYTIGTLVEKGYIEEKGRLNLPGKPYVYGTTVKFMSLFGLSDISQLPEIEKFRGNIEET